MRKMHIIGVDVSKLTLDLHCYGHCSSPAPVSNNSSGFKELEKWIKQKVSNCKEDILIVMEYTGIYTYNLERFLHEKQLKYVKRPALDILRSCGIRRGKTDVMDAKMISQYGWMRQSTLKPTVALTDAQIELQQLMAYRDKLVADKASYQSRLKELKGQMQNKMNGQIEQSSVYIMDMLTVEIKQVEKTIRETISCDEALKTNYDLLTSITGIGFVTAIHLLITTENFSRFENHRKFACYCGVAPFAHTSGSSIRGKTRVSHLANKKIKSLLTMAALTAIKYDRDLKNKYHQKLQEGKPKMCALNIIRVKLIERIFTIIARQTKYELRAVA
jgi:transposase